MEQKVIEIARGVAKTSTFATKNEALRFAKSEGGAAIGIYENGGMYMFAFGAYKPQMVYSKLVYELKKAYNTGVHRTYTTDDGVFVAYMPLRKKMRRHGHGSPVPPSSNMVFIGDENAALIEVESDLLWREEDKSLSAMVFVKSTAYDNIDQSVIEVEGTQISVTEVIKSTIAEAKEDTPSIVIPDGFGDSDYFIIYAAANVDDITAGDKASILAIDGQGEVIAQTAEKEIYIVQAQTTDIVFVGGENAALLQLESDLQWKEEDSYLSLAAFVKAEKFAEIDQAVVAINGTQAAGDWSESGTIAHWEEVLGGEFVLPEGFEKTDYLLLFAAENVSDIAEGDKAKVVLIDSEGEEFAQTNEKEIYIVESQEIYAAPTIGGESNPVAVEAGYNAYYAVRLNTQERSCKLVDEDLNEIELTPAQALSTITEQTVEAVPEFASYIGWYYDVVPVTGTESGKTYTLVYKADEEENDELTLTIEE